MPRVLIREHLVHYQQIGHGPDLVLIHGLLCNIAFWWHHIALKLADTHRVTALDLRGHGFSAMSERGYSAAELADDVAALMTHLGIGQAQVVGHSFGGAVALAVAVRHPECVSRVTLADAWIPSLQAMPQTSGTEQPRLRARGIMIEGDLPRVARGFLEELLETDEDITKHDHPMAYGALFNATALRASGRQPPRVLRRWRELMARTSAVQEINSSYGVEPDKISLVDHPVDLVYGARSRYLASRDGLERLLPHPRTIAVPNAGHFFPLLRPEALLGVIVRPGRSLDAAPPVKLTVVS